MNLDRIKIGLTAALLTGLLCLCGCVHEYLIKLNDGDQVISLSKPKFQGTNCYFIDTTGSRCMVPRSHVAKIRGISMVHEGQKPAPSAPPKKPRHWYFLWLA